MKKPSKVIIDKELILTDIMALQITFNTVKDTGEPYEVVTVHDSRGGVVTYPLSRAELIQEVQNG